MSNSANSVKLYTSGVALVSRGYKLEGTGPTKITIPVKKTDLDEVVASLSVFGNVNVPEPPSYTPVNANATTLTIAPNAALKDTVTKLAGAEVELTRVGGGPVRGKLVGAHTYEETNANGMTSERMKVAVLTDQGLTLVGENEVQFLKFTDEATQTEYLKALAKSYQTIKPDSSFVELTVVPNEGAKQAFITYATPIAAWKPRYQLRFSNNVGELEGVGIVDNDSEDNWKDSILSLIVGDPIAFETDVAEIRRPARQRVNIVSDTAQGAVNVAETVSKRAFSPATAPNHNTRQYALASASRTRGGVTTDFDGGEESLMQCAAGSANLDVYYDEEYESVGGSAAYQQQADVKESGDFAIFTSPSSVNINSKKSALVPLFKSNLGEAKIVLYFKKSQNQTRAFRAVRIKNETKHSLGKGTCEIYLDGYFQGKAILANNGNLSPGDEDFLVHAKENGVRWNCNESQPEYRRVGLRVKDSVAQVETASRCLTTYSASNVKDEAFEVVIEHDRRLPESRAVVNGEGVTVNETKKGWRITYTLKPKQDAVITVTENATHVQAYGLQNDGANWLYQNIVVVKNPLSRNNGLKEVLALQDKANEAANNLQQTRQRINTIAQEQTRLKDTLIPNVHADQAATYRTEMAELEQEYRTLTRTTLPEQEKAHREAVQAVRDALAELTLKWSEKPEKLEDSVLVTAGANGEQ